MLNLLLITLAVAVVSATLLFKLYHIALLWVVDRCGWNLEELKTYEVSPTVKTWDQIIQGLVMLLIIWKVMN